jgi:hypothetical protein
MLHIEAVIKMLDPSFNLARITVKRRKANGWFKRGTLYRKALDVLRTAEQQLTATDIAWKMLEAAEIKNASKTDAPGRRPRPAVQPHQRPNGPNAPAIF